jgi:hypothetical protein
MARLALLAALLALAACGNRDHVAEGTRAYQGKPDTPAWGAGDRTAWEAGIKARQLTQNEYQRIGR